MSRLPVLAIVLSLSFAGAARAAPFVPTSDDQVLERLPLRAADPRSRELAALRTQWRRDPNDLATALRLAERSIERAWEDGDPRHVGHAQAALAAWWGSPDPPVAVRVLRAVIHQYSHRFDEAIADLDAAVAAEPDDAAAWSWLAAIRMVRAEYPQARAACTQLGEHAEALIATACLATVESMTGRAAAAAAALRAALHADPDADAAQRLWALTRLGEIEERRGNAAAAEAAYREALALGRRDVYLLAAYADFLLDQRRGAEVLQLLKDGARADVLLLRLALAAKSTGDPRLAGWTRELQARFDATTARGDTTHRKEEARFALHLLEQPARALQLARENFAEQREAADARILLEAAWAARQRDAAQPALQWLERWRIESVALRALADRWSSTR